MVEHNIQLDAVFHSLANPTRRDMLRRLRPHHHTIGELAEHYRLTFAAVSKHLQVLEHARLVRKRRRGREQLVELSPAGLGLADNYLKQYRELWEGRMDRLAVFLKSKK